MLRILGWSRTQFLCCGAALALFAPLGAAQAKGSYKVLYAFAGGSDGSEPSGGLISDKAGNLYGATEGNENGNVFKLTPDGILTVLYSFNGGSDGAVPLGSLLADSTRNLYGTTVEGGGTGCGGTGCGTVFKVTPDGGETVLYAFKGGSDGDDPNGNLISDTEGNLYGTTYFGNGTGCNGVGCGSVFEIAPDGSETVLHAFAGGSDGAWPAGGLIADSAGNFYGTAQFGGGTGCGGPGCGVVFKLAPDGTETILYSFAGGDDGDDPGGRSLVADSAGNLYGTTQEGGGTDCNGQGCGTVFKLTPHGREMVLYSFKSDSGSLGGLVLDASGNLYGTTPVGGNKHKLGKGTAFVLSPNGQETVLVDFGGKKGVDPNDSLMADGKGNLYGTTNFGGKDCFGQGCGVVFRLKE